MALGWRQEIGNEIKDLHVILNYISIPLSSEKLRHHNELTCEKDWMKM